MSRSADQAQHAGVRWVFLRALALVYLAAFLSLLVQVTGLVGSDGILPAAEQLERVRQQTGVERYWLLPTLGWVAASDAALRAYCLAGALLSIALLFRLAPALTLFLLWGLYLSLVNVSEPFLPYQWDVLLLETGFLAIFLAPLGLRPARGGEPSWLVLWLLRVVLFRLMFSSGAGKLLTGDPTWRGLTALEYHYWTQPLPTWVGYFVAHLPDWFQRASCAAMLATEVALPLLIFGPRSLRLVAFGALAGFQVLIALTGNYAFFNLLTLALCLLLLDDGALPGHAAAAVASPREWSRAALLPVAGSLLLATVAQMTMTFRAAPFWNTPMGSLVRLTEPFRLVNSYGLFTVMTTARPEIVVEGSDDGQTWRPYEFRWKPGDPTRRPGFVAPHQPRLDWQMWFAALQRCEQNPWFFRFQDKLLEGSPTVLGLLAGNPFPARPPRAVRTTVYEYRFSTLDALWRDGRWWQREPRGVYCPPRCRSLSGERPHLFPGGP